MTKTYRTAQDFLMDICDICGEEEAALLIKGTQVCKKCARIVRKPGFKHEIEEEENDE